MPGKDNSKTSTGTKANGATAPKRPVPVHLVGVSSKRTDGFPKVYWTATEHAAITDAMLPLLDRDKPLSMLAALKAAQLQVLPINRQRPVHTISGEVWLQPAVDAARQRRLQAIAARSADEARIAAERTSSQDSVQPPPTVDRSAQEAAQPGPAPTPAPEEQTEPAPPIARAAEAFASVVSPITWRSVRAMVVDELASVLVEAGLKAMGSLMLGQQSIGVAETPAGEKRLVFQRAPSPARKPSLLVVGLKTNWRQVIEHEFADQFDLRFYSTDESKDVLRRRTEGAERTIVMTDHISHSHQDIVKARNPHFIPQSGSVNHLKETMAALVPRAATH